MKDILTSLVFAVFTTLLIVGCVSRSLVIDRNDIYSYSVGFGENDTEENVAARARYYAWGARTQYPSSTNHLLVITLCDASGSNIVKRAQYRIKGENNRCHPFD